MKLDDGHSIWVLDKFWDCHWMPRRFCKACRNPRTTVKCCIIELRGCSTAKYTHRHTPMMSRIIIRAVILRSSLMNSHQIHVTYHDDHWWITHNHDMSKCEHVCFFSPVSSSTTKYTDKIHIGYANAWLWRITFWTSCASLTCSSIKPYIAGTRWPTMDQAPLLDSQDHLYGPEHATP